ncbi:type IV pilus modification PilV family protein [Hydrogenothermus marinus]|uniref:Prepilin-type N-terminal cleavage/methylation domain-containing protein n=1 Tax=Hydrogenothermus marinus TaxID=133270 RepID=A0A3M0BHW6_9AQUI|nr:prepilin-type N-terminal cleavage/methylation domain-containing protein [Hydrogenothermus marinus]RMA97013.1 prepilin-type N-terminal cleavage/methylation domain-containing protein [Hydrogenothermus marinus]
MDQVVKHYKGFTIIEALVSLVILAILLVGLLAGLNIAVKYNLINHARDEARLIAQECSENIRNIPFNNIIATTVNCNNNPTNVNSPCMNINKTTADKVQRKIRNLTLDYNVGWKITDETSNLKKIIVNVCWKLFGKNYKYTIETLVSND